MQDFRLANVLLENNERMNDYPNLYCRTVKPIMYDSLSASFTLFPYEKYDFATYFNLFSNIKWKRYTVIDNVKLHLEIKGHALLTVVSYSSTLAKPKRRVLQSLQINNSEFEAIDYDFKEYLESDFFSFEIVSVSLCALKHCYYYTSVDPSQIRPVELAVATTTFKQEEFIESNINLFKQDVLACDEPIADHFTIHVMDNGGTLDANSLEDDCVFVHPNKNVGGAGGFARGMIEAMEQKIPASHVLLMDDDVQISPESLKRTFNLLSLVNDEYKNAFISGIMLSYEAQDEMYEDIGWVRSDGLYGSVKPMGNAGIINDVIRNEVLEIRKPNRYAGWWYCCIPVENIKEKGLPLPLFIRGDDAEYGNRAATRFMSMNGICIWHLTLALKYRAHLERYQVPRNSLIAQSTTGVYSNVDFMAEWEHNIQLDMKTFNYDSVELSLAALEDYLKGPDFIMKDMGESIVKAMSKKNEMLVPLDQLDDSRLECLVIDPSEFYYSGERTLFQSVIDYLSFNGHRLPNCMLKRDLGVIPWDGWFYPAKRIRMHRELLVVSKDGRNGIVRKMDKKRFRALHKKYKRLLKNYRLQKDSVAMQYRNAKEEMISVSFWKRYLDI